MAFDQQSFENTTFISSSERTEKHVPSERATKRAKNRVTAIKSVENGQNPHSIIVEENILAKQLGVYYESR